MTINDNGFDIVIPSIVNTHTSLSEGAIVGIVLGWIFGSVIVYIAGIMIIWFCFKRFVKDVTQQSDKRQQPQKQKQQNKEVPRRKKYQDYPTMQMVMPQNSQKKPQDLYQQQFQ